MSAINFKHVGVVNVTAGNNVTIVEPSNVYDCRLGDDVFVGPFVEIQRGVSIGARSRIQSHAFVCELVEIGEDCVVAHGVMFINDPYTIGHPARGQRQLWKPTRVGARVAIGSNATILPVEICDDVVVGAGAVVTRNISASGVYAGNPARRLRSIDSTAVPRAR